MVKPVPLVPGARIGVIAPASIPPDPEQFAAGCRRLEERGYELVHARENYEPRGYLSGTDAVRLDELESMIARDDITALFCARGGYGTLRLLGEVDYELVRQHPTLLVGYSDITALQLALYTRTGLPSVSGPMIASDWHSIDTESENEFWDLATGACPCDIPLHLNSSPIALKYGRTEGTLIGGNLTMFTRLLGTPYIPSLTSAILFVEDIGEPPYRIDGMLASLRLAGVFDKINGMIFGQFTDSTPEEDKPSLALEEVLEDYCSFIDGPIISNASYGHCTPFLSVPIGVTARLTVTDATVRLTSTEAVVHENGR
jgi:muramoyltetrapeptide carboxypeptidase